MTVVLKHGARGEDAIRPLNWRAVEAADHHPAAPVRDPAIVALEAELETAHANFAKAAARHVKELELARAQGRDEARATHQRDDAAALAMLERGVSDALAHARARVDSLEQLALLLVETALEKVFTPNGDYRELTARAIARQLMQFRRSAMLRIAVSEHDFPEQRALEALSTRLGANVAMAGDPQLPAGACRIDLRLGHIDISLAEHWDALKAELRRLASAAGTP